MDSVTKKSRHLPGTARMSWRSALAAVLAVLLPALSAFAAPVSMTDIGFNALPGGKFEIERSKRSLEGFALLFIDLDHFKIGRAHV